MSETGEQLTTKNEMMKSSVTDPTLSIVEVKDLPLSDETPKLEFWSKKSIHREDQHISEDDIEDNPDNNQEKSPTFEDQDLSEEEVIGSPAVDETEKKQTERELEPPDAVAEPARKAKPKKERNKKPQPAKTNKQDEANVHMLLERCRNLCISLFYRENAPVRSLGFTSSIQGEGKSFFASTTAQILAHDSTEPVTLIECDWEHPTQHEYFGIPATPGLAEWLRGSCDEDDIRYQVDKNLTVIPAGNGSHDAVKLLNQLNENGLHKAFKQTNQLYIVDLPSIITTGYGSLAASLLEAVVIIVRAQVIQENMVVETCSQLNDSSIHGIILNQIESHIPRWLRQLL